MCSAPRGRFSAQNVHLPQLSSQSCARDSHRSQATQWPLSAARHPACGPLFQKGYTSPFLPPAVHQASSAFGPRLGREQQKAVVEQADVGGAPKGTILELFSTISWQICRRSSSTLGANQK